MPPFTLNFPFIFFQPGSSLNRAKLLKILCIAYESYWGLLHAPYPIIILSEIYIFLLGECDAALGQHSCDS